MSRRPRAASPALESLEGRRPPSAAGAPRLDRSAQVGRATGPELERTFGSSDTIQVLQGFVETYLSSAGGPRFDPAYDLNHNGQIGQDDGRILLRKLPPVGPPVPLSLQVKLAPEDQARGTVPTNSGGVTHDREPTVVGRTTPGSLIFTGTGTTDLKLRGPAAVAGRDGSFRIATTLTDGINQFDLQAVDPFGRQTLRAFPIYWLDFGRYEAAHPKG